MVSLKNKPERRQSMIDSRTTYSECKADLGVWVLVLVKHFREFFDISTCISGISYCDLIHSYKVTNSRNKLDQIRNNAFGGLDLVTGCILSSELWSLILDPRVPGF